MPEKIETLKQFASRTNDNQVLQKIQQQETNERRAQIRNMLGAAWIPADFMTASLADRERVPEAAVAAYGTAATLITEALSRRGSIVLLVGKAGGGKSHLLCAAIRWSILRDQRFGRYLTARRVWDLFSKARVFGAQMNEDQQHAELVRFPVLALDECDKAEGVGADPARISQIIVDRHAAGRVTLVAGNFDDDGLMRVLGPYVVDRANAGGKIIKCGWGKLRGNLLKPIGEAQG